MTQFIFRNTCNLALWLNVSFNFNSLFWGKVFKVIKWKFKILHTGFFLLQGISFKRGVGGEGGCCALYSKAHVYIGIHCTSSHAVHFTVKLNKYIYI